MCGVFRPLDGDKEQMKCLLKLDFNFSKAVDEARVPKRQSTVWKTSSSIINTISHEQNAAYVYKPGHNTVWDTQDPPGENFRCRK